MVSPALYDVVVIVSAGKALTGRAGLELGHPVINEAEMYIRVSD